MMFGFQFQTQTRGAVINGSDVPKSKSNLAKELNKKEYPS